MGEGFVVMQSNDVDIYYYQDEPGTFLWAHESFPDLKSKVEMSFIFSALEDETSRKMFWW